MSELLNLVALVAVVLAGVWIWRYVHHFGLGALVLIFVALWAVVSLAQAVLASLSRAWSRSLESVGNVGSPLLLVGLLSVGAFIAWRVWQHWRARQYFDF